MNLKAELQKTKDATRVAREAAEAAVNAFYERGVLETETCLAEEVAIVCRDYVIESWGVAMDRAGVPAKFKPRRVENIFFPEDIREILNMVLLLSNSLPPKLALLMVKFQKGLERMRRLSFRQRPSPPRMPS